MKCQKCNARMRATTIERDHIFAGVTFPISVPGFECPKDRSWALAPETVRELERRIQSSIATHGPVTPLTLKALHGATRLKGVELARLLGIKPETLSRWENGKEPINPTHWALLAALVRDMLHGRSATLKQLRAIREPGQQHEVPRIEVA